MTSPPPDASEIPALGPSRAMVAAPDRTHGGTLGTALEESATPAARALRARALKRAREYAGLSRSAATRRAYEADWRTWFAWCASVELTPVPAAPDTLALFLAAGAADGRAPSTLQRRLAAIRLLHRGAGLASPHDAVVVTEVMAGIRRAHGRPPRKVAPAVDDELRRMVDTLDVRTIAGLRDRVALVLGFAAALRRSELVALEVDDLEARPEGLIVTIRRSKTDQEARGQSVAVPARPGSPYCPAAAILAWRTCTGIDRGPLLRRVFRGGRVGDAALSTQSIAVIVKAAAARAGLDPARYSGHSLRRGFLTSAGRNRADLLKLLAQSRHASVDMVRGYIDEGDRFERHAGEGLLEAGPRAHRTDPRGDGDGAPRPAD